MENVRIYDFPPARMLETPCARFGEGVLEQFSAYIHQKPQPVFPEDFLQQEKDGTFIWRCRYQNEDKIPPFCAVTDFAGGLYAAATGRDDEDNTLLLAAIRAFVHQSKGLIEDTDRACLCAMLSSPNAARALGYGQMIYFIPVKMNNKEEKKNAD